MFISYILLLYFIIGLKELKFLKLLKNRIYNYFLFIIYYIILHYITLYLGNTLNIMYNIFFTYKKTFIYILVYSNIFN